MATKDRTDLSAQRPRTPEEEHAGGLTNPHTERGEQPRHHPATPDPRTGEVRAGPGDAGLEDRPEINAGSAGTRQMSNKRLRVGLGLGLGLAALCVVIALVLTAVL